MSTSRPYLYGNTGRVLLADDERASADRVRITQKGQVTVPKRLRDRFGITNETEIEFREERGKLVLVKTRTRSAVDRIRGCVKALPFGKDVDEYLKTTRGER